MIPEGLELPKNIVIDADNLDHTYDQNAALKVLNERKPGKINLKKVDNKGKAVAGVAFELQMKKKDQWVQIVNPEDEKGYYRTAEGGFLSIFRFRPAAGTISIDGLKLFMSAQRI